ncbi:MAG: Response regulator receiver domain protein [bacterium ADurb.Bin478]|nr:MAG: Response regulator receiver domain protein [bacterium ADurb.Bin478]
MEREMDSLKRDGEESMQNPAFVNGKKRIVLATMDRGMEDALKKHFTQLACEFSCVQRSMEALSDLLDHGLDLLILDMDLYGNVSIDVLPVLRRLRPRLPVVLLSDDLTQNIRTIAAEQGVTYQTEKPHDAAALSSLVDVAASIIAKRELLALN